MEYPNNTFPKVKLRECAAFQEGYVNPSQTHSHYFGTEIKWLRAVDLNDSFVFETSRHLSRAGFESAGKAAFLFKPGTLAISKSGTIGRLGILKDYMCGNRAVINIQVDESKCDNRFIFYSLLNSRKQIEQLAAGSVQRNLYCSVLGELEIDMPSLPEQKAIANILGTIDDKIELNRQMNVTLEATSRALFKSWFIDFEPVRANSEKRPSVSASPEVAKLFPSEFEDNIPKGWELKKINQVASKIQYGYTQSSTTEKEGLPKFLRITDIQGSRINWSKVPYCVVSQSDLEKYSIKDHDIFIARTGASTGENVYVTDAPKAVFASYLIRVQFDKPTLAFYVGKFLRTNDYLDYVASILGGSAQPNANAQELTNIEVLVPNDIALNQYFESVHNFEKQKTINNKESQKLAEIRDSLLPRLISGKVSISEAANKLEDEIE